MAVRLYTVKAGEPVPEDVAKILGVSSGVKSEVNIVAFLIEGGVMTPEELATVDEEARTLTPLIDTAQPVIVSGRGPLWLYGVLVHNLHYARALAVWEPRVKAGIVISAPTKDMLGKALLLDGTLGEADLPGKGVVRLSSGGASDKTLLHVEIVGDRFARPAVLRGLELPAVPGDKPLVVEGKMPVWLASHLVASYMHKVPAIATFDPRLRGGVVVATHTPNVRVGDIIEVKPEEIEAVTARRATRIIGIVGDPNSGKSVFLHLLNNALRRAGATTLTQEADLTAPTQEWSLHAPEVRKELKKIMNPEERLAWIVESLRKAKESSAVDVVLADIGGGRPDLGQRVTRENMAILRYVDGLVIVSRNDSGQISAWIRELKTYTPDIKVYAVLESQLAGTPSYDGFTGMVVGLDRRLYREGRIPQGTEEIAVEVARRILAGEAVPARELDERAVQARLERLRRGSEESLVSA